ncbi:MAG: hypothetical protein ACOC53_08195 [Candidatus Saliniplasma sp.]
MKLLRDKKKLTKFLILYHSALDEPNTLADIAEELDMTQQGVSNYMKEMSEEGLIDASSKGYHPTSSGIELVRDVLSELSVFVSEASQDIDLISKCTAIADEPISEGDDVGLFMKDGFLHASLSESSSMGQALNDADIGEPVQVGALKGITEMDIGRIYLLPVREEFESKKIEKELDSIGYDKVAVSGELQYGLGRVLGLDPDIMFAPLESSIEAAEKGLDVLFIISTDELDRITDKIRSRNKKRDGEYKIGYELVLESY